MSDELLLKLLADGRFHSGEDIANNMHVSRAQVWKLVHRLEQEYGLDIYSVKGKGYKLAAALDLLDDITLRSHLLDEVEKNLADINLSLVLDSTNRYVLEHNDFKSSRSLLCATEMQTAGKGRRGRQWVSPFAQNLYFSLSWRFQLAPAQLSGLSLVVGILLCQALEKLGAKQTGLKWPNDLLVNGKKLAGILLEMVGEQEGPSYTVIGIGLNLSMQASSAGSIDQPWVDLHSVLGAKQKPGKNQVLAEILNHLIPGLKTFERYGMGAFMHDWQQRDVFQDQPVNIVSAQQSWEGVYRGIEESGAMLLETDKGIQRLYGGEISLRLREQAQ